MYKAVAGIDLVTLRYRQPATVSPQQYAAIFSSESYKVADLNDDGTLDFVIVSGVHQPIWQSLSDSSAAKPQIVIGGTQF